MASFGNRVYKKSGQTERKYIVDITGRLPVILLEIQPSPSSLKKTYIYADRQIIAQHDGDMSDDKYFYLHDRLGSVRLVINDSGNVVSHYTYEPFGEVIEDDGTFENAFRFTGQYFDFEIEEYYLRARQYNPAIARFTSRDPVRGRFTEPLTLHKYLYCNNDSINRVDPDGKVWFFAAKLVIGGIAGGINGYYSSGGKNDAKWVGAITGAVAGMFSSVLPGRVAGAVVGTLLSGVNNAYANYRQHGSESSAITGFMGGMLGGSLTAGLGLRIGPSLMEESAAFIGFLGGEILGFATSVYSDGATDKIEGYIELNKELDAAGKEAVEAFRKGFRNQR